MTKRPKIPNPMEFEGLGLCWWDHNEYRCPNRGEFYASGAIPEGYRARQHLTTEYWIVRPTHKAYTKTVEAVGRAIQYNPKDQGGGVHWSEIGRRD